MLRWMTPFLVAIFAVGTAAAQIPEPPSRRRPAQRAADSPAAAKPAEPPQRQAGLPPATKPPPARRAKRAENCRRPEAPRFAPPAICRRACPAPTTNTGPRLRPAPRRFTCAAAARWWSRKRIRRAVHAGGRRCPMRRASSARRCCRAHRRCPAITEPAIPTAMTAPITAARPMALLEPAALRLRRVRILLNAH